MVQKVEHKDLKEIIRAYYNSKISLFISGRFGIGKSVLTRDEAQAIAKEKKKEFVEWNKLTEEGKNKLFDSPKKYFVYIDIRLSEYSPDDIKGLPMFLSEQRAIEFKIPLWALYLEKEDSDGFLMFDEINLAVPLVMSSVYKIVYDRVVNQSGIAKDWLIVMAGNTSEDRAYTHEIPPPLRDRCGEVELEVPSIGSWTEWAVKNNINSSIIGYVNSKNSELWKVNYEDNQKFTTPRGWERFNNLLAQNNISIEDYDKVKLIGCTALGEGVTHAFVGFCKIQNYVKIADILKNPTKLKDIKPKGDDDIIGIRYFIITAIADWYRGKRAEFKDILEITKVLDEMKQPEFVALLWKMCMSYRKDFEKEFLKIPKAISEKYLNYFE
jgi:hypothetical protein